MGKRDLYYRRAKIILTAIGGCFIIAGGRIAAVWGYTDFAQHCVKENEDDNA